MCMHACVCPCVHTVKAQVGGCLSVPISVLVRGFPQDAGACICLSVHVHVRVMLQGLCILRRVSSMTVHFATTIGADISARATGMSVCLSETVCLSVGLSVG